MPYHQFVIGLSGYVAGRVTAESEGSLPPDL